MRSTKLRIFKTVLETSLLYGSDTWTLRPPHIKRLRAFHHACLRRIIGELPQMTDQGLRMIPNTELLTKSNQEDLIATIHKRRIKLFHRIQRMRPTDPAAIAIGTRFPGTARIGHKSISMWVTRCQHDEEHR